MKDSETNPALGKAILEIVENQLRGRQPPETYQAFERLRKLRYSGKEARRLIATAVTVEIYHITRDKEDFNRERFLWNLAHLPEEPWDKKGNLLYKPQR